MCGIAGLMLPPNQIVSEDQVSMLYTSLIHRGPDNQGAVIAGCCGFAHTRLSIMDLSDAGNQPVKNERYILVFNGEIYNYLPLREKLLDLGVNFKSTSDTEVLFYHLIHFGVEQTLLAIRGMFAFSFYDTETHRLFLCRDRLGIKPLFWTYQNGGLYWASEVKAIAAVTPIQPDPVKALYGALSIGDHSSEYTVFKDVQHVPPGSYLEACPGEPPHVHAYYNVIDDVSASAYAELDKMSFQDVQQHFEDLFSTSVKSMLMSDAPMGAFVSGGIDSSLIAVFAHKHTQDLSLFTANVVGRHSEVDDARRLASSLQQPLYESEFLPEMMLDYWVESTYHYEVPIVTHTNAIPFAQVAKLAHQHQVKAVLTGEGSDELFLGYPRLLTRRFEKFAKLPVTAIQSLYQLVPGLKPYLFPEAGESNLDFVEILVQNFERQRIKEETLNAYHFLPERVRPDHSLTIQMIREGLIALLLRNDRMGMLAGIESRFPFLDENMIRFAVNLPVRYKIGRTLRFHNYKHPFLIDKHIVRQTAENYLPASLVHKRKNGFPMYGHKNTRVKPGFFTSGYLAEITGLTPGGEKHMIETYSPYFISKLMSVEVFGRLFAYQQPQAAVTEHLKKYATVEY